jgi:hypothetical protein
MSVKEFEALIAKELDDNAALIKRAHITAN